MNSSEGNKYIYHLPFLERSELCKILNQNDKWEELAGTWMKYDVLTIQNLRREKNPTDELLTLWGHYNHTITELFVLLARMQHYQSMVPLLPFVDQKFHQLLHNGEGNLQRMLRKQQTNRNTKDLKIGAQNFNEYAQPQPNIPKVVANEKEHCKILNQPMAQLAINRSDSNNLLVASPVVAAARAFSPSRQNTGSNDKKMNESPLPKTEATLPRVTYSELGIATNGWNKYNILGKGGFGTVYRGTWKNTDVAIKRIERKGRNGSEREREGYMVQLQQSLIEIKILDSRAHENILPLYAYSFGGDAPCLVYQLMRNGSLEDRLLVREKTKPLTWIQRHEIAKGTARGLQYLHTIGEKPLIHGDIKSANILLDKNFEPKIGDFGLAREGPENDSDSDMQVSRINGTRPYLPEDFLFDKKLSTKIDTYSYGIVLFEIATGLRAYDDSRPENKYLRDFIFSWEDKDLSLLIDKKAGGKDSQVYGNLIVLGKWCAQRYAQDRPEMELVFRKLNDL
ncbi:pelle-like serine/threonine-protein kinase pik-1 isoform X1 [Odontomachus brunneus]|uniref:pelle-like serine/threonine-protein kinase pik-1 isoform X1 n=1 Tax=Odontomachus brunneus TaxID=486640 RepID=UPI0013F29A51|nr:pelle-like serine/threonine-protein kinase pik-1 isoform X1 [Odontomachus brunneus]